MFPYHLVESSLAQLGEVKTHPKQISCNLSVKENPC